MAVPLSKVLFMAPQAQARADFLADQIAGIHVKAKLGAKIVDEGQSPLASVLNRFGMPRPAPGPGTDGGGFET